MDFAALFRSSVRRNPEKLALVVGDVQLTYRALEDRVRRLAGGMSSKLGVTQGDTVGIFLFDGVEWVETYLALSLLGACPVAINYRYGPRELTHLVSDAHMRFLIYDQRLDQTCDAIRALPEPPQPIVVGAEVGRPGVLQYEELAGERFAGKVAIAPTDIHTISYTSGTTGLPKGAIYTHLNTVINCFFSNVAAWALRESDVFVTTTPLCHRTGQTRIVNALGLGATLVVMPHFEPDRLLDFCERYSITVLAMVPTMARRVVVAAARRGFDGGTLRILLFTGEAFPAPIRRQVMEAFPRVQCYSFFAGTETGLVTNLPSECQLTHAASVGRPLPGIEVRVVDESGQDVPDGRVGELWVRSGEPGTYAVCKGYVRDFGEERQFVDGWFRTGDLGRYDEGGFLYIVDRKKDMILSGGTNIASKEVEEVIGQYPKVAETAVVGVPDAEFGEAVAAYVVLHPGQECTAEEITAHCRATMASYKKPRYVKFVDCLPRNSVGKLSKLELRERAQKDFGTGLDLRQTV